MVQIQVAVEAVAEVPLMLLMNVVMGRRRMCDSAQQRRLLGLSETSVALPPVSSSLVVEYLVDVVQWTSHLNCYSPDLPVSVVPYQGLFLSAD